MLGYNAKFTGAMLKELKKLSVGVYKGVNRRLCLLSTITGYLEKGLEFDRGKLHEDTVAIDLVALMQQPGIRRILKNVKTLKIVKDFNKCPQEDVVLLLSKAVEFSVFPIVEKICQSPTWTLEVPLNVMNTIKFEDPDGLIIYETLQASTVPIESVLNCNAAVVKSFTKEVVKLDKSEREVFWRQFTGKDIEKQRNIIDNIVKTSLEKAPGIIWECYLVWGVYITPTFNEDGLILT